MEGEAILLFTGSGNSVSIQCLFTCYYLWQAVSPKSRESVLAPYIGAYNLAIRHTQNCQR
jgi:hypothetical protein